MTLLTPSDPRYRYEGRIDFTRPAEPVLIWSGTRASLDFAGERLALVFSPREGQSVFDVTIDQVTEIVDVRAGGPGPLRFAWPHPLGPGRHHLDIFKRSEAAKGQAAFLGAALVPDAPAFAPAPPTYRAKFEFFGDSITAGACNEDGAEDQWNDFRTHNHAQSYACLTSRALGAEHRAMAYSGMGISIGWEEVKADQIWNALYPRPDSPRVDPTAWQPDVAFVNLGENDTSFTEQHGMPFPPDFTRRYVALVREIRGAYPRAQIVLLRGGMGGGAKDPRYATAWDAAVRELEAGDVRVTHYVFRHWSKLHPRVSDHHAMADELTAWLKRQPFLAAPPSR